jgi:menaquinone-dependent protoporphyrinogen oxidase
MRVEMKLLIAYATAHGSTAEIAQFMGDIFAEKNFEITVASVDEVKSVEDYDAFVLGSAIHAGMWLTPLSRFLDRFEDTLMQKPVALFITCIRVLEPDGREHALKYYVHQDTLDKINALDVGVFAGKLQLDSIDLNERWTLSLRYDGQEVPGTLSDDFRDWDAIRQWALATAERLR